MRRSSARLLPGSATCSAKSDSLSHPGRGREQFEVMLVASYLCLMLSGGGYCASALRSTAAPWGDSLQYYALLLAGMGFSCELAPTPTPAHSALLGCNSRPS